MYYQMIRSVWTRLQAISSQAVTSYSRASKLLSLYITNIISAYH
jgi:hypothetical protein